MYVYACSSIPKYDIGNGLERLIYVGSTIDYERRFSQHTSDSFRKTSSGYNTKFYRYLRQYGIENFTFEVIEVLDDDTTEEELCIREQFYIEKYDSKKSMNSQDAWIIGDRKEHQRLYLSEWFKNNKDSQKKKRSEYYKNNVDLFKKSHGKWYKKNADIAITKAVEWNKNNRDRRLEISKKYRDKKSLWKKGITELQKIDLSCFE